MSIIGCSQEKTLLSDEIKSINPYKIGQNLIFVSNIGNESVFHITKVEDGRFPDGLGAFINERLVVDAFRESKTVKAGVEVRILTFLAKDRNNEERIEFNFSLKEAYLQMSHVNLSEYQDGVTTNLTTNFGSYDDVLIFKNYPSRKIYDNEIVEFYWSKSVGYVRMIQKNGTFWDLKSIE